MEIYLIKGKKFSENLLRPKKIMLSTEIQTIFLEKIF